ncbi:MAG: hypothetical protein LBE37_12690 [Sphingobacterium sp.]|jgi:hypothetical protein|nr:hypothetical protein [Sphingobacterium sp.]
MESQKRKHFFLSRWSKWLIGIFAGLLLIGLLLSWYISRHYKDILRDKISEKVYSTSQGLYHVEMEDLQINLLTGSAQVKGLQLKSDTAVYAALKVQKGAPATRIDLISNSLKIEHLNLWKILVAKKISVGEIKIDTLNVKIVRETLPYEKKDTSATDLYARIKDSFKELRIDQVVLTSLNADYSDASGKAPLRLKNAAIQVADFFVDPNSFADSNRVFYSERVQLTIPGFDYSIPESPYRLAFDNLKLDSKSRSALLHKIRLEPKIPKEQYFQNDKQNKALIVLEWDTLRVKDWDLGVLSREGKAHAKQVFLTRGAAVFRKDRRYQKDNVNKIGEAPHQQIMKLKQLIRVDTIHIDKSLVQYRQINEKETDEGIISFVNVQGIITNMTNDSTQLLKDKYMRADLKAMLMGKGPLHALFGFDMRSKNGAHTYKGSLGHMDASAFNLILMPLLNLEIASGNIKGIRFDMKANDSGNWGDFRFDYDDFKVNIFGGLAEGERKKKGIVSFFVNKFMINDSNPDANEVYHIGKVNHIRVPEYSHFKTIWKSLQDGIAQCAGIESKWLREKM